MTSIKNRFTSATIHESESDRISDVVLDAIRKSINLRGADLGDANLGGADLRGANLRDANLRGADLRGADLRDANLRGADLGDANLGGADLRGANLGGANIDAVDCDRISILPDGDIIGWKKCRRGVIVKLKIAAGVKRSNSTGRKCRAESGEVLEIFGLKENETRAFSLHDCTFSYSVGETVRCNEWCDNRWVECGGGIHFFITRSEAEAYY